MVSLKPTRFFLQNLFFSFPFASPFSVLFLSCTFLVFPFPCPFFSLSFSVSFSFLCLSLYFSFPFCFLFLFLSCFFFSSCLFPFLFLFFSFPCPFLSTLSPSISPMRALDEINTHEVQHGVSLFGKVPSLSSVFCILWKPMSSEYIS